MRRERHTPDPEHPTHVVIVIADHFEPGHGSPGPRIQRERVARWHVGLSLLAQQFADADGRPPLHTFFFPAEEYRPEHLDALAAIDSAGLGEVEIHLHHDNDTSSHVRETLEWFRDLLCHRHGLVARDHDGRLVYGFVHGNWALDNSRPDGRWCGVNDEITILQETGCYGEFTMPCAPDPCQTRTVNSIYYAIDDPVRPKSHDTGIPVRSGSAPPDRGLLVVQGPLAPLWSQRKWGIVPRLENAALDLTNPPTLDRLRTWLRVAPFVDGRPDWIFLKLHAHGATEPEAAVLLGPPMVSFLTDLTAWFNEHREYRLHFATAREMVNMIKAAESGAAGDPNLHRDHFYRRP